MKVNFIRKACSIQDLKGYNNEKGNQFLIEEIIELEPSEFGNFAENLLDDYDFIAKRTDKMFVDSDRVWHCILIKAKDSKDGILVESEGYDYARYSAYYQNEVDEK